MKKNLFKILFILSFYNSVFAQSGVLSLSNATPCPEMPFIISLFADRFEQLGAASILIEYDSAAMIFDSISNTNEIFTMLKVNEFTNKNKNVIGIAWYNINGVNIDSTTLLDLNFTHKSGSTEISLSDQTELADNLTHLLNCELVSGSITPSISIIMEPLSKNVNFPEGTFFSIISEGSDSLQWQVSNNNGVNYTDLVDDETYFGANSDTLLISSTCSYMSNFLYRCNLSNRSCSYLSKSAQLSLTFPPQADFELVFNQGWNSFSSYLYAGSFQMDSVFSRVLNSLIAVTDGYNVFSPSSNNNTLEIFSVNNGYQVKVSEQTEFLFDGYKLLNNTINLNQGWNLIPILSSCQISVDDLDEDFLQNMEVLKDGVGLKVLWPAKNIRTLQILEPGKSYFVKMQQGMELSFPDCGP